MSSQRHDTTHVFELPAGMGLVVSPRARRPADAGPERPAAPPSSERALLPPFVHRGERRQAAVVQPG